MMERIWYIKNCRIFESLSEAQLSSLEKTSRIRRFPKNAPVYMPSDLAEGVFLLAEGRVKLCANTSEGKQAILAFIEPGELFGELALLGDSEREEHAEAVLASTIVLLPGDELERIMADSSKFTLGVTKLIGWRRRRIERRLKTLLFRSNRERVIHLLLELAEQYGQETSEGVLLTIRLSHQDLASIIGATRETVTVLLGELQLEGLLKVARQRLVVKDLERLSQTVGSKPPRLPDTSDATPSMAKKTPSPHLPS